MRVLYIDVDSLRPDHTTPYGYGKPTTPNLATLAEDGVVFDRAYAAASPCMPSRAAALTGRYGINNGVVTHGARGRTLNDPSMWDDWSGDRSDWWTLPEVCFHERMPTGAVSSFPRHPSPWFYHLWHEFYQPQEPPDDGEHFQTPRAETVADLAAAFVDDHADDEFFLYTQFWDPHTPYNRSSEAVETFRDGDLPPYPTDEQIADHQVDSWRSAAAEGIDDRNDLADVLARYDAEINYADAHVGRLLDDLRDNDIYDDTLIIVTADHGEEFGEHGLYREHWSTYDGTQRVPLLIKPPADMPVDPGRRDHLVTNVDVAPTIASYLGIEQPSQWQGRSLRPVVEDANARSRERVVTEHGLYTAQRAVRTDRWKLVRTYHPGLWDVPDVELFDVEADPWEQTDVAGDYPDVVDGLMETMAVWVEERVGREEDALHAVAREGPAGLNWVASD